MFNNSRPNTPEYDSVEFRNILNNIPDEPLSQDAQVLNNIPDEPFSQDGQVFRFSQEISQDSPILFRFRDVVSIYF